MIKRWREEQKNLLILDAGDLLFPPLLRSPSEDRKAEMILKAEAIVAAFNATGTDAITIGESDLLWGKENLLQVLGGAEFSVVCTNLVDGESGAPLFRRYLIKEIEGLRVGIFGLFPRTLENTSRRLAGLTVLDPLDVVRRIVPLLTEKADFVILLSHLGYPEDLTLAKAVDGIDVIVGGHTGINLSHPRIIGNTIIVQVATKGRYLGKLDLRIEDPSRPFVNVATKGILERRLHSVEAQIESPDQVLSDPSAEQRRKESLKRQKAQIERRLQAYKGYNELVNRIVPLTDEISPDPECEKILAPYLLRIAEARRASGSEDGSVSSVPEKSAY